MGIDPRPTKQSRAAELDARLNRAAARVDDPSQLPIEASTEVRAEVNRLLLPFLLRDDGWLRITPQDDGGAVYWKWKWTAGPYINHYVMVRYTGFESTEALTRLAAKVHAVDSGEQRPVKDHYFKGDIR